MSEVVKGSGDTNTKQKISIKTKKESKSDSGNTAVPMAAAVTGSGRTNMKRKISEETKEESKSDSGNTALPKPAAVTGYMLFSNERRGQIRAEKPKISFAGVIKIIGEEWNVLPADLKQRYVEMAEEDKERYVKEYAAFNEAQASCGFEQAKKTVEMEQSLEDTIPVFTEEFLEYNAKREAELSRLLKENPKSAKRNRCVEHNVVTLKAFAKNVGTKLFEREKLNTLLEQHLEKLKLKFVEKFADLPLPGTNELPTIANIDQYVFKLRALVQDGSNTELVSKVKDIMSDMKIDFDE